MISGVFVNFETRETDREGKFHDSNVVHLRAGPGFRFAVRLSDALVADPEKSEMDCSMSDPDLDALAAPDSEAHRLFPGLALQANPAIAVSAICTSWMRKQWCDFTSSQSTALEALNNLMEQDHTIHDETWPQPALLIEYVRAIDGFFFAGRLQDHLIAEAVPSDHPAIAGAFGRTYFVPGPLPKSLIYVDSLVERCAIDPQARRQSFLGILLHEMMHALLDLYTCPCANCHLGIGPNGHGIAWERMGHAANEMLQNHVLRYDPPTSERPDDVGVWCAQLERSGQDS